MGRVRIIGSVSVVVMAMFALATRAEHPTRIHGPQDTKRHEYKLKAAFLYNFMKFVTWPSKAFENKKSKIVIAVVGEDRFGRYLDALRGRKIHGRAIAIARFKKASEIKNCHVLFVSSSSNTKTREILKRVGKKSTLTIGETGRFVDDGGAMSILIKDGKPGFEVNLEAAAAASLKIRSKLLKRAMRVVRPKEDA